MHRARLVRLFGAPTITLPRKNRFSNRSPAVNVKNMQEFRHAHHSRRPRARTLVMDDYSRFYAALGVNPDTDWETLRGHYKRLIGKWHPDRFSGDTASRKIAEERSKQITIAYQALGNYRRKHGVLPPRTPAIDECAQAPSLHADPVSDRANSQGHAGTGAMGATVSEDSKRPGHEGRMVLALLALIGALYLADRYAGPIAQDDRPPSDRLEHPDPVAAQAPAESPRDLRWIWPGSTVGEVYAVQGVPTSTQGETWHYGKSQIRFAQGKVISWNQHPDNPLRIARDQPVQMQEGTFDVGSTKDEVRAIQGTPVTETETVWDYGPSRVHFKNNRVTHWEDSPMQPLHVAH